MFLRKKVTFFINLKQGRLRLIGLVLVFSIFNLAGFIKAEEKEGFMKRAIFAGGCFWCMQPPFDQLEGVVSTRVGYAGGTLRNPTYEQVSEGNTGHAEVIEVTYDPSKVDYEKLLDTFWKNIDPTTRDQQFADRGPQYRTAIFYLDDEQKKLAEASKEKIEKSGWYDRPIVTEISPAGEFYSAEEYHQKYYEKQPGHYEMYKYGSGRAGFLEKKWGKKK